MADKRIVIVHWLDSGGVDGWAFTRDLPRDNVPKSCVSLGYVIDENDTAVTIGGTVVFDDKDEIEQANGAITIPKVAITSICDVTTPKNRAWAAAAKVLRNPERSKKAMTKAGLALGQRRTRD